MSEAKKRKPDDGEGAEEGGKKTNSEPSSPSSAGCEM
jgi:hypothetical protein